MTWQPIDLAEVAARRDKEILRVAAVERIEKRTDPYDGLVYAYDEQDGDEFDGSNCSDEVMDLIRAGLLTDRGGVIRITDAGRAYLAEVAA